jgi:hypothetical protein
MIYLSGVALKAILISLFVCSSMMAVQNPQSKEDCFLAHTKFKALNALLSGGNYYRYHRNKDGSATTFESIYADFLKECIEEMEQNKNNLR